MANGGEVRGQAVATVEPLPPPSGTTRRLNLPTYWFVGMADARAQTIQLVRLAVERVAHDPADEQRYLELNFALDRAVERDVRYRELLALFAEGAMMAKDETAWAWRLAAGLGANLLGDPPVALWWLEQAEHEVEKAGLSQSAAASFLYSERARAHLHRGEYGPGVEAASRALQLARAANSLQAEAYAHHYLGLLSLRRREYDYARRQIQSARDKFQRMNQRQGRARVLDSLATLEMELGHYDEARRLLDESLSVKEELRDLRGQALTCGNLARLYLAQGDFQQALHYLEREQKLVARVGDDRNSIQVRVQLGELHLRYGNPERARTELLAARTLARERANARLEAFACYYLADAEWQLNNLPAALEAVHTACAYFDSSDDAVTRDRTYLRCALLEHRELDSPEVQLPLERIRSAGTPGAVAEALFATAAHYERVALSSEEKAAVTRLYAEALEVAEPTQADQFAAILRARAATPESRAWVDAILTVKHQKDKLESAYSALQRAETHRQALIQMIVHDLKNPLTAIVPALQTIQMGVLSPEEEQETLQHAVDECDYLLRMIEDLNDVGKTQHEGALELQRCPVDLRQMLTDSARRLTGRARESGMEIRVLDLPDLPTIEADGGKLRRVLDNLVANAIKYGRPPEGSDRPAEVQISAALEPAPPMGGTPSVRIEVRDFGEGIPLSEAERVFEAYYQAEAGRKRKAGVGLGLALCRMVVDAHGGTIWSQPAPGGGTVFAFRLPVTAPAATGSG